jgi:hypothetical protein
MSDITRNLEIEIMDADNFNGVHLDVDRATTVLKQAGVPVLGLAKQTVFDGSYQVDVPRIWFERLVNEEDGEFESTIDGYLVSAIVGA